MNGHSQRETLQHLVGETRPDPELLARYRINGDEAAFAALMQRHARTVRSAAARMLRIPADIEDVAQATFLVLLRRAATLDPRTRLGPWLSGVAHRIAVRLRARNRRALNALQGTELCDRDKPQDPSWREACETLHAELDRLHERFRLPLLLCYLEGMTREEAATALGLSVGTVKGRVRRGLAVLQRRLTQRGVTLSAGLLAAAAAQAAGASTGASLAASVLGSPSTRAIQLATEMLVTTATYKWVAFVAILVAGAGGALGSALATTDKPADHPPASPPTSQTANQPASAPARTDEKPDYAKLIVGKWVVIKAEPDTVPEGAVIEFTKDGKLTVTVKEGDKEMLIKGSYELDGNKLTTKVNNKIKEELTIAKISATETTIKDKDGKDVTLKKK